MSKAPNPPPPPGATKPPPPPAPPQAQSGPTPQIAICRAIIASVYGDEVPEVE